MIEVRNVNTHYYEYDTSNIQAVVDELKANNFEIDLDVGYRTVTAMEAIDCRYCLVKIPIVRGEFKHTLILSYREWDTKKQKIIFDPIVENGMNVGVYFDIQKVIAYYEKWDKRNKQKTVRENVSAFKGPLLLSYIRGTLDNAGIEYEEMKEKYYSGIVFKTKTYSLTYNEPTPGELAKLNMERVELTLATNDKKLQYISVPLKKFVENVDGCIAKLSEMVIERKIKDQKTSDLNKKYTDDIEKMKTQLSSVVALGYKEAQTKFENDWKELFYPKKKK